VGRPYASVLFSLIFTFRRIKLSLNVPQGLNRTTVMIHSHSQQSLDSYHQPLHPTLSFVVRGKCNSLMTLIPSYIINTILSIKPTISRCPYDSYVTYHFTIPNPPGVRLRMWTLPFPTKPKFAPEATAIRSSKNGEKARE
jgi:hypothetical protein